LLFLVAEGSQKKLSGESQPFKEPVQTLSWETDQCPQGRWKNYWWKEG